MYNLLFTTAIDWQSPWVYVFMFAIAYIAGFFTNRLLSEKYTRTMAEEEKKAMERTQHMKRFNFLSGAMYAEITVQDVVWKGLTDVSSRQYPILYNQEFFLIKYKYGILLGLHRENYDYLKELIGEKVIVRGGAITGKNPLDYIRNYEGASFMVHYYPKNIDRSQTEIFASYELADCVRNYLPLSKEETQSAAA